MLFSQPQCALYYCGYVIMIMFIFLRTQTELFLGVAKLRPHFKTIISRWEMQMNWDGLPFQVLQCDKMWLTVIWTKTMLVSGQQSAVMACSHMLPGPWDIAQHSYALHLLIYWTLSSAEWRFSHQAPTPPTSSWQQGENQDHSNNESVFSLVLKNDRVH